MKSIGRDRSEAPSALTRRRTGTASSSSTPNDWSVGLTRLRDLSTRLIEGRLRRIVTKALALKQRGFVRHDVLVVRRFSGQLQVEWWARDIHSWDRDRPPDRRERLFCEQALRDSDEAIVRVFNRLPEIDSIDVRVLAPRAPHELMLAGRVGRLDALATRSVSSTGMRLKLMGMRYQIASGPPGGAGVMRSHACERRRRCTLHDRLPRCEHDVRLLPDSARSTALLGGRSMTWNRSEGGTP